MERVIKFRAYWPGMKMRYFVPGNFEDTRNGYAMTFIQEGEDKNIYLGKAEIMQYTGLKDKNGVEIYEGDVVQHTYRDVMEVEGFGTSLYQIAFQDGAFGWIGDITGKFFAFVREPLDDIEVIGNAYQNPSLLTSTHKP